MAAHRSAKLSASPYFAGAIDYSRIDPASWRGCLRAMHDLGLTVAHARVVWRDHETSAGSFDWSGARDLRRFLDAVAAAGLRCTLALGPHFHAELAGGGMPDWMLADPAVQVRTARDMPAWMPLPPRAWPIPSYASAAFHAHVRRWFAAVADIVRPCLAPDGPVARSVTCDEPLPMELRTDAGAGANELDPERARAAIAAIADEVGLGATAPPPTTRIARVAIGHGAWWPPVGVDSSAPVRAADRARDDVLAAIAGGARGVLFDMAVERDRHVGAAISADGSVAPHAQWIEPLLAALAELDVASLAASAPPAPAIALVDSAADARFAEVTNVLAPVPSAIAEWLPLGGVAELGTDAGAHAAARWQRAVRAALDLAGVAYDVVDDRATAALLARYRAVIAPTHERIDRALWRELRELAAGRKTRVVIGPGTPSRDERDQPLDEPVPRGLGRLAAASVEDVAGLAADLSALAGERDDEWRVERPAAVVATAIGEHALIVRNAAPRDVTCVVIAVAGVHGLRDAITGERMAVDDSGRVALPLRASAARLLAVE